MAETRPHAIKPEYHKRFVQAVYGILVLYLGSINIYIVSYGLQSTVGAVTVEEIVAS